MHGYLFTYIKQKHSSIHIYQHTVTYTYIQINIHTFSRLLNFTHTHRNIDTNQTPLQTLTLEKKALSEVVSVLYKHIYADMNTLHNHNTEKISENVFQQVESLSSVYKPLISMCWNNSIEISSSFYYANTNVKEVKKKICMKNRWTNWWEVFQGKRR